jgi:hypothetical protein
MRSTEPPRFATWLLNHFGCSPNNATVIGDLDERYRSGRSALWYWRQAFLAITVSFLREVWSHKWLTVRAIITGWAVFVISRYGFNLTRELFSALEMWSRFWRADWITITVQAPEVMLSGVFAGWLIARLHQESQRAMVLAYAAYFAGVHTVRFMLPLQIEPLWFDPLFSYGIAFIAITTIGVLLGGGVFSSRGDDPHSEEHSTSGLARS